MVQVIAWHWTGNNATEISVKFQHDQTILNINLEAYIQHLKTKAQIF